MRNKYRNRYSRRKINFSSTLIENFQNIDSDNSYFWIPYTFENHLTKFHRENRKTNVNQK